MDFLVFDWIIPKQIFPDTTLEVFFQANLTLIQLSSRSNNSSRIPKGSKRYSRIVMKVSKKELGGGKLYLDMMCDYMACSSLEHGTTPP